MNTTSSGSAQNCPMKARFRLPLGTTCGLSPFSRGRNWLVMKGNMQGMWRGPQDFRSFGLYLQLTQDFGHQLTTGTG
jgi:hypothetical protein